MKQRLSGSCASRAWHVVAAILVAAVAPAPGARASFESPWPDARCAGLAAFGPPSTRGAASDAAIGEGTHVQGIHNQETHVQERHTRVEMSACELYGLPEARAFRVVLESVGDPTVGVEFSQFGSDIYEEHVVGLGVSRTVAGDASVELRLRGLGLAAPGAHEEWCAALDAGVSVTLLRRIRVRCHWDNLGGASIRGSPVSSAGTVSAALGAERLTIIASALLEAGMESSTALGVEFELADGLTLRAGTVTRPCLFAAGLGVTVPPRMPGFGGCVVDLAWQWHPELGGSSFATLSLSR